MNDITCPKNMAKFNKILKPNNIEHLGLLKRADGKLASCPQQSINILLSTHHPGCLPFCSKMAQCSTVSANDVLAGCPDNQQEEKGLSVKKQKPKKPPSKWREVKEQTTKKANAKCRCQKYHNIRFCTNEELEQNSFITERSVYLAVKSFGPNKTGGPDSLKPQALQYFVENKTALSRLTKLFQSMIELGYSPQS